MLMLRNPFQTGPTPSKLVKPDHLALMTVFITALNVSVLQSKYTVYCLPDSHTGVNLQTEGRWYETSLAKPFLGL